MTKLQEVQKGGLLLLLLLVTFAVIVVPKAAAVFSKVDVVTATEVAVAAVGNLCLPLRID